MSDAIIPFLSAVRFGSTEEARDFLSDGQDVGVKDELGMTALHWSVYHGKFETARLLIAHGAAVKAMDASGETPLQCAAARRMTAMADCCYGTERTPTLSIC